MPRWSAKSCRGKTPRSTHLGDDDAQISRSFAGRRLGLGGCSVLGREYRVGSRCTAEPARRTAAGPSFPAGPRLPGGPPGGSGNYAVSAAANEHGAFLWVVDNVQHAVVLCEKADGGKDFTCIKKPLP